MMKKNKLIPILITIFISFHVNAKNNPFSLNKSEHLIESCREVIKVYKNRTERNFLAAQMTSVSEAMRAGFCVGVIKEYIRNNQCPYSYDSTSNWYDIAESIANYSYDGSINISTSKMLYKAYCNA